MILFERHVFRDLLIKDRVYIDALERAEPNLVNAKPGGYVGGEREWGRLNGAILINRARACEAASWGLFQVMGYHWKAVGYNNVQEFVNAMFKSEREQLMAFCLYVKSEPEMVQALREKNWPVFASLYNGREYQKNAYDTKLKTAYAKAQEAVTALSGR